MADSTAAPSQSGAGVKPGAADASNGDQKSTVLTDPKQAADGKSADAATAQDQAKADDGKQEPGKQDPGKKDDGEPQGAPETYAEFKAPEGVSMDKAALEKFVPIAKELNLTQEQAQKVVDLYAGGILPAVHQQLAEAHVQQVEQWLEAARTDKEIGGAQFDASVSIAKKALDSFGTPELKAALDDSGLGNHPEVIRLLANIGKRISEDGLASLQSGGGGAKRSPAEVLYGSKN